MSNNAKGRPTFDKLPLLIVAVLVVMASLPRFCSVPSHLEGKLAPDVSIDIVANGGDLATPVALQALRGHVVVLAFWATWCPPCNTEAPILNRVWGRFRDRGLVMIGVSNDDSSDVIAPWAIDRGVTYPLAFDRGSVSRAYSVSALPTVVVISKEGNVLLAQTGMVSERTLSQLVEKNLRDY